MAFVSFRVFRRFRVLAVLALGASVGGACSEVDPFGKLSHSDPRGTDGGSYDAGRRDAEASTDAAPAEAGRADAGHVLGNTTLAAGVSFTCALWPGGTVRCWGDNSRGQLGDGTLISRPDPAEVLGLEGVVEITSGVSHSCALTVNGSVRCWGFDDQGQLGDGEATLDPRTRPVDVQGLGDVIQIAAGSWHTCALRREGTVRCWGWNRSGEVGDGTTLPRTTPTDVTGLAEVVQITAGGDKTCALRRDHRVACWGRVLTAIVAGMELLPTEVAGLGDVVEIAAGDGHTLARRSDGTVRAWGSNTNGELGDYSRTSSPVPVNVYALVNAVEIAAGGSSCARVAGGRVLCWGAWDEVYTAPFEVAGVAGAEEIAVGGGGAHACARLLDGTFRCWGYNGSGEAMAGGCCHDGLCGIPEGASCGTEGTCAGGWCSGCGGAGQPCCDRKRIAGQRCHDEAPLCTDSGCSACGGIGEPCCEGSRCRDAKATCFDDRCVETGTPGAPCLPGNVCPDGCCVLRDHSDFVCAPVGTACPGPSAAPPAGICGADGSCGACGGLDQPCCASSSTRIAFYCSAPGMVCDPSGVCRAR